MLSACTLLLVLVAGFSLVLMVGVRVRRALRATWGRTGSWIDAR
jgi:hypothetical protein